MCNKIQDCIELCDSCRDWLELTGEETLCADCQQAMSEHLGSDYLDLDDYNNLED